MVESLGPIGVALLVVLENLFPPIPSEIVLPIAGFVAATGGADLAVMIAAATVGSLVGAGLLYGIAAAIGPVRLRRFVVERGRWFGLTEAERLMDELLASANATRADVIGIGLGVPGPVDKVTGTPAAMRSRAGAKRPSFR